MNLPMIDLPHNEFTDDRFTMRRIYYRFNTHYDGDQKIHGNLLQKSFNIIQLLNLLVKHKQLIYQKIKTIFNHLVLFLPFMLNWF